MGSLKRESEKVAETLNKPPPNNAPLHKGKGALFEAGVREPQWRGRSA
jgi:hypothetical protein